LSEWDVHPSQSTESTNAIPGPVNLESLSLMEEVKNLTPKD